MIKLLVIAWRNLWRNKRRTFITTASVFFAVIISTLLNSVQEGSYNKFIQYAVECYSGHIQIQHKNYHNSKSITHSFKNQPYFNKIRNIKNVKQITKRFAGYALASGKGMSLPTYIQGIVPGREEKMTGFGKRIIKGGDLIAYPNGVIIGDELARILKLNINDTITFSGQGLNNKSVSGKFKVTGIISYPSTEFNKVIVYMHINKCRKLFYAPNMLTSVVITCKNNKIGNVVKNLKDELGNKYRIIRWDEIQTALLEVIRADKASGTFVGFILYLVVSFGVFSTIMMLFMERKKEFAVMVALGMKKTKLIITIFAETIFIAAIGTFSGIAASIPIIWHYVKMPMEVSEKQAKMMTEVGLEPFINFSIHSSIFIKQAIIIFSITILLSIYPIYRVRKIKIKSNIHN
jgi:ABC-type lipoprotein release transport system permease subunit